MRQFVGLITLAQIAAPGAPTVALISPAVAGNIEDGAHSYKVTFLAGATHTAGGTKSDPVTVVDKSVNGKVQVSGIPVSTDTNVTSRKLYRTIANADPTVAANYLLLATIADNTTTTFLDNVADGSLGAAAPTTNDTVADDYPVSIAETLSDAGMEGATGALAYLNIAEAGSGNLVISSDPDISAEASGYPIGDGNTVPILELNTSGAPNDVIDAANLYLFSATAGKQAYVIARPRI
jgi:hypothetical protein